MYLSTSTVLDPNPAVKCKLLLYADDSALLVSGKDVSEVERTLRMELGAVSEWLCENRLSLHLGRTQSILFGSKKLNVVSCTLLVIDVLLVLSLR